MIRVTLFALLAGLAVLVAGCSSSGSSASTHNAADVAFASDMIPHHRQAVNMADMTAGRASDASVQKVAATIKSEQQPEITTMTGWLKDWGKPVPSASMGGMHDSMPGMMSDADMAKLASLKGAAFDRMWVTMMITHHQGALTMARTEVAKGQDASAKALARSIIAGQTKEIVTMKALLAKLPTA